jgi:succinate dehydrogenase/fumarate reductase flavoprotein subunit
MGQHGDVVVVGGGNARLCAALFACETGVGVTLLERAPEQRRPTSRRFAAGEMVGGIFYFNYPGGSGRTNGSVFGRIASRVAAMSSTPAVV